MAREIKTLSKLADEVLSKLESEQLVKSANLSYTNSKLETQIGQQMVKVAELVREAANGNKISYADLDTFRKRYGI
jgi:hypothetical protein